MEILFNGNISSSYSCVAYIDQQRLLTSRCRARYRGAWLAFWVVVEMCSMQIACTRATPADGSAGSAMVAGVGTGRYFVIDASGKSLTNADTNTPVELLPGTYTVILNGTTQSLTVRAGEKATLSAGSAVVTGTGKGRYFVLDTSGKGLTNADTNAEVELFPGTYTVALNGTTQSLTVRAGEKAAASAGSAMLAGTGGRYFISDASGKSLTNADANTAVELFPGTYTAVLNGTKESLTVRPEQQTLVRVK